MSRQRLQKILAQAGVASRRAAEQLILEGRVRVNGRIVRELGTRADPFRDRVEVRGQRLVREKPVYWLLHKPRGVVTTLDDPEGRTTVKDFLHDVPERVFPVGRLDFHTSGVLLLTNDGALAQALLHPRRAVPKTYAAKLQGQLEPEALAALRSGVVLDDGAKTAPAEVSLLRSDGKNTALEITIAEGKNRQIHRMGEAIGHAVLRLTRVSFAGLTLEGLPAGRKRVLTVKELNELKQQYVHGVSGPSGARSRFESSRARSARVDGRDVVGADQSTLSRPARSREARPSRTTEQSQRVRDGNRKAAHVGRRQAVDAKRDPAVRAPQPARARKRTNARGTAAVPPPRRGRRTRVHASR